LISGLFSLPLTPTHGADFALRESRGSVSEWFIAGPENALVRSLASAVSSRELPYNPIVLHGPAGAGKSSVAEALVALRREKFGLTEVISTTAADLVRALAHAAEAGSAMELRARHHRCDILFVDDVHRLAGKPAVQEFLLAAIDALVHRGSLVMVTLRHSPLATRRLSRQLASRLAGGLVVNLALPGPLARRELVRQSASRFNLRLTDEEVSRLAHSRNGATEPFVTAAQLRQLVLKLAADGEFHIPKKRKPAADDAGATTVYRRAATVVAKHFGLTLTELKSKSRRQALADARGLAMYLARQVSGASYAEIGRHFGGRDHTTVLHACQKTASALGRDDYLRQLIDELAAQIVAEGAA
jgi:chromosomal replication initiator protein